MKDLKIFAFGIFTGFLTFGVILQLTGSSPKQIKNAAAFAASAAQYAFTTTLPMPNLDPKLCFWRSSPMRRETQCMLLFLIRRMCRTYLAATSCVQKSRGLIAIQSISLACAACISDAISHVITVDNPSEFSLHYITTFSQYNNNNIFIFFYYYSN